MTEHARVRELAVAAVDFTLDADEERFVRDHLAECGACREVVAAIRADATRLDAASLSAPSAVRQRVLAAAIQPAGLPLFQRPLLAVATVLLLVALAATGIAVGARLLELFEESRLPAPSVPPVPAESALPTGSANPSVAPTPVPEQEWLGYRFVQVDGLPLLSDPSVEAEVLAQLSSDGTVVSAWNAPVQAGGNEWQFVHYAGLEGWVSTGTPPGSALAELGPDPVWPDDGCLRTTCWGTELRVDIYPDVIGPQGTLTFMVDINGVLIQPDADGYGWTQRRLTAAGHDLLSTTAGDSGLLDESTTYAPPDGYDAGYSTTRITVYGWSGPIIVEATNASDAPEASEVTALGEELVALVQALPETAVVDPALPPQPWAIPAYNVLVGMSEGVLDTFPESELAKIPLWLEDAELPMEQPLLELGEAIPGRDLRCSVIDAASAAGLRDALYAAGYERAPGSDALASFQLKWRATNGLISIDINAVSPDENVDCSRYGGTAIGACVDSPDLAALLGVTDKVGCYGDADLTVEGWLTGIGAYDPVLFVEPSWLCCPYVELHVGRSDAQAGLGLWLVAADGSGIDVTGYIDSDVRVTGHFDDPAAQSCRYTEDYSHLGVRPEDAVIDCQRTFVVTSITRLD